MHGASAQKKSETQMTGAKDSKPSQDVANKKNSEKQTSSTAKSKPISSEGTNSEGQTRTDIRNEAVKQHNKRKKPLPQEKRKQES